MIVIAFAILGSALVACLVLLYFSYTKKDSTPSEEPSLLPSVGQTVPGTITLGQEHIRVYFKVAERKDSRLLLEILSELGNTPLLGMSSGTYGRLDVGSHHFPISITQVRLPWVEAEAFPLKAKPIRRQSARIPVCFAVRFHKPGIIGHWETGEGIDLSAEGMCFCSRATPIQGSTYEIEITIELPAGNKSTLRFAAEVRWVQTGGGRSVAGFRVIEGEQQRELARFVAQLERQMARRPKDYLSETKEERPSLT